MKDNNDRILIKCSDPPKSPSCPLPQPAILTPPLQGQMNENEQSCGVILLVSNQYPSPPPLFHSRLLTRPLFPHPFLCSDNFLILLSSVGSEELTCVCKREINTQQQKVLSLSEPFSPSFEYEMNATRSYLLSIHIQRSL